MVHVDNHFFLVVLVLVLVVVVVVVVWCWLLYYPTYLGLSRNVSRENRSEPTRIME